MKVVWQPLELILPIVLLCGGLKVRSVGVLGRFCIVLTSSCLSSFVGAPAEMVSIPRIVPVGTLRPSTVRASSSSGGQASATPAVGTPLVQSVDASVPAGPRPQESSVNAPAAF